MIESGDETQNVESEEQTVTDEAVLTTPENTPDSADGASGNKGNTNAETFKARSIMRSTPPLLGNPPL